VIRRCEPGERPLSGGTAARYRPKPDIGDVGLGARKLTVVLSSSGWPLWDTQMMAPGKSVDER